MEQLNLPQHGFALAPQSALPAAPTAYADAVLGLSARPMQGMSVHRDVPWGDAPWQQVDIFTASDAKPGRPVLIFWHGGGWTNGYKEWCGFMAPMVSATGAILVAPTYRLAPENRYPAALEDSLAIVGAARARIAAYGGDPDRLYLSGHSAGGHLAALVALRHDLWAKFGIADGAIRASLPISGILDLHHADPQPGSLEAAVYEKILVRPSDDREASPINWAAQARVPLFLAWGEVDTERVRRSNERTSAVLAQSSLHPQPACYPGHDHFQTHLGLADPAHPWWSRLAAIIGET